MGSTTNTNKVVNDDESYSISLDREKYKNALLYFIKYCNNSYLGTTKLNKLFYYLDFINYKRQGRSVTNDNYMHKEFGPVPEHIDEVLSELKHSGEVDIKFEEYKDWYTANFDSSTDPDMEVFEEEEKEILQAICHELAPWPTSQVVSQTHLEAPWFYSDPYQLVSYEYASDVDLLEDIENEDS